MMRFDLIDPSTGQEYREDVVSEELISSDTSGPYLVTTVRQTVKRRQYNQAYNDMPGGAPECECGHAYHRHFDGYENSAPVGCKYCNCYTFVPLVDPKST